jgi:hypothetical protein
MVATIVRSAVRPISQSKRANLSLGRNSTSSGRLGCKFNAHLARSPTIRARFLRLDFIVQMIPDRQSSIARGRRTQRHIELRSSTTTRIEIQKSKIQQKPLPVATLR